jgi:hypothetical protein
MRIFQPALWGLYRPYPACLLSQKSSRLREQGVDRHHSRTRKRDNHPTCCDPGRSGVSWRKIAITLIDPMTGVLSVNAWLRQLTKPVFARELKIKAAAMKRAIYCGLISAVVGFVVACGSRLSAPRPLRNGCQRRSPTSCALRVFLLESP